MSLECLQSYKNVLHSGFSKFQFKKMLKNCVDNNVFLFNEDVYEQVDGCPMGGCISPTMANVFLCFHESNWLNNCPPEFKPILYKRYVDDCFLLFRQKSHINLFHQYINQQHNRIQFTCEIENSNSLPFLDILITKNETGFQTSTFHKSTHTGLGMKYTSAISSDYKFNIIDCLVDRAHKICSTPVNFQIELKKLKVYFAQNGYNVFSLCQKISKKIRMLNNPTPQMATVSKRVVYCSIPFMSNSHNDSFKQNIGKIVKEFFPHVNLRLSFKNNFTISSMFRFKDVVPTSVKSNIVYKYQCGICHSTYIGESARHYNTRVAEHRGVSSRTGAPLKNTNSNVFQHFFETGHTIKEENFKIICQRSPFDLKISESIAIHQDRPCLNDRVSSATLNILD